VRLRRGVLVALVLALLVPASTARAFPTPQECATGDHNGVTDEGAPRGAVCVGAAGHNVAYVGGDPAGLCGTVLVADVNVVDGPTRGAASDPNHCPYAGWATVVHDPAVARDGDTYYLFGTGAGIPIWTSHDRNSWQPAGTVFSVDRVPWAPDISFFAGTWHLYYAVSTFGSKNSTIGLATNPTLDQGDPRYKWTDRGVVVRSDDTTPYNAIDPNVIVEGGRARLTFGSAFGGLYGADLGSDGRVASRFTPVASRLGPTWVIEAAFVVKRAGYYYLFASFDACCRGSESTYNVRVGRSTHVGGPYLDDRGVPMLLGGGRLVLASDGTRRGPGHEAVLRDTDGWRLFFHYYDATANGTARLGILPIRWTSDGWPTVRWTDFRPPSFGASA
jgi:arabinan endo-1,5-alpha-L-arabinosidase